MELTILLFLANNPQYDTASQIVSKRHLSKSHVSTSIRSLEEKGLLSKELRNGNHRNEHLLICSKSNDIIKKGQKLQKDFLTKICNGISDSQKKELLSDLQIMNENLQKALMEIIK